MEMDTKQFRNVQESERYDIYPSGSKIHEHRIGDKGLMYLLRKVSAIHSNKSIAWMTPSSFSPPGP